MFHFKQFSLSDDNSTMKVGTDSVLFASFLPKYINCRTILDVGTGCGVIALILAHKFPEACVYAIDIDENSYFECKSNFQNSPFKDRLNAISGDFKEYKPDFKFDLIVSNPPFFNTGIRPADIQKSIARHDDKLSFAELCAKSAELLNENGQLAVIIPSSRVIEFTKSAQTNKFFLINVCCIFPKRNRTANRHILIFSKQQKNFVEYNQITIREENLLYTSEYKNLVSEYYLDFLY